MVRFFVFVLGLYAATAAADRDLSSFRKYTRGELIAETSAVAPGQVATVGLRLTLAPRWHTYWINPGDSGTPLRLTFDNGRGVSVKRVLVPLPQRFETGPLITFGFADSVTFPIELEIGANASPGDHAHVRVEAEWLVCEDVCIPALDAFELDLPVRALDEIKPSEHFAAIQRARTRVPLVDTDAARMNVRPETSELVVSGVAADHDFVDFFPFKHSGVTNEAPVVHRDGARLRLELKTGNVARARADRIGVLVTRARATGQTEARQFGDAGWTFDQRGGSAQPNDLWFMLLSAFVGGLILNLMPCVFPILSIKLLSLLKLVEARPNAVRMQNGAYVLGVLLSFLGVALTLSALRSAGNLVGWGFQLQSPLFLSLLIWLFFGLSLNLLGLFEIDWLGAGFGHRLTRFDGALGSFFTGVLAVVVASPCTAPFMGVALGFGLAQPTYILVAIFLALGLGLAFPYVVFAVRPGWIRVLPRPGAWMLRVKQAMAFPLLLTDLWLIWVLGQLRGPNAMVVALAVCVLLGAALFFSRSYRRWAAAVAVAILAAGFAYVGRDQQYVAQTEASDVWKSFTPALLESLKGRNVFVDVTADWCLTCKVNERLVLGDAEIMALFARKDITLIRADWTQRNPDITRYLNRFSRVGVPFYVLYSGGHPEGRVLPELLTKSILKEWINQEYP